MNKNIMVGEEITIDNIIVDNKGTKCQFKFEYITTNKGKECKFSHTYYEIKNPKIPASRTITKELHNNILKNNLKIYGKIKTHYFQYEANGRFFLKLEEK